MKTLISTVAIVTAGFAALAFADNHKQASGRAGLIDSKTSGHSVRASKLIGMNIENSKEENVGEINDIVLDSKSGKIQYLAVTYGGFLGLGNKMFAVPFEAIACGKTQTTRMTRTTTCWS